MGKTVFNRKDIDFTKQPMFFGEDGGVQRYDVFKYPQFDKLNQTMLCLLYTSPSPRDLSTSRMPSSA